MLPGSSLLLLAEISLQGWDGAPFPHRLLWMEISAVTQMSALGVGVVKPSRLWEAALLGTVRGFGAEMWPEWGDDVGLRGSWKPCIRQFLGGGLSERTVFSVLSPVRILSIWRGWCLVSYGTINIGGLGGFRRVGASETAA